MAGPRPTRAPWSVPGPKKSRQEEAYIDAKIEMAEFLAEAAQLRMTRIDGMRAELAATLADGAPVRSAARSIIPSYASSAASG